MSVRDPRGDALQPDLLDVDDRAEAPAQPRAGLRAAVLSSISGASRLAGFGDRLAAFFDLARERAAPLIEQATRRAEGPGWESISVPGVRLFHLPGGPRVAAADCGLVRIEPGARFPAHRHLGDEWCFVLSGEVEEEGTGARWAPGDLVQRPAGTAHALRVTSREPLVFAVVLYGGLEFAER